MSGVIQPQTATLAKLYADQGFFCKAALIYRELVAQHPQYSELRRALEAVEKKLSHRQKPNWKEIHLLMREWVVLLKEDHRRKK